MKTIVVPFDFSPYSLAALQTAQRISAKNHAKIICVTVIPSELDWDLLSDEAKSKHQELIREYNEAVDVLPGHIKSVAPAKSQIEQVVKIGVPNEQIVRVAEKSKADIIILGAYGKGYTDGKFIGSTLQKVLRNANCPVLAVKHALDGNAFRKIAFATVFNPAGKIAFEKILPLAKAFKTSIHLLFVNTPSHFTSSSQSDIEMAEFGKGHEQFVIHRHVYNHEDAELGIMEFCAKAGIQLVGLVSADRRHASSYVIGTTETLIFKSELGILSLKA
ncbi:universal stress protein [Algoriphagus lacus]|uniref:Universal stress protein n=1 Tax=Algoriphagus lacus TaxID=2056311 RepID=A0A418PV39_9BACT|nr:universal stress protein [Algoriphagus lacus]RIW17346.1 universal stress protein [Algoriphagus lacus]